MNVKEFVENTIINLDEKLFNEMKAYLMGEYITFSFVDEKSFDSKIFAEKINDYFEKIEFKNGKSFEKIVDIYAENLDEIVRDKIAKEPKTKKNEPVPKSPRARKYYERANLLKKNNKLTEYGLIDYTRIMLCLYIAAIKNEQIIDNFNYSSECLNLNKIMEALHMEREHLSKKNKFDLKDPYSLDRCTFVIVIIMYYYIKSKEIIGEY